MAGNQSAERKNQTSSGTRTGSGSRKSSRTQTRSASGNRKSTKKSTVQKSAANKTQKKEQGYTEPVIDEIKLIITLAVCVLILLSVFGLGGRVGDKAAYYLFGVFGILAYALPFVLFIGIAFHMSNRNNGLAYVKIAAAIVFMAALMAVITIVDTETDITLDIMDGFLSSAASREGGGLIGYALCWLLYPAFGRIASTVILVCILLISGVLVTGRRIFTRLGRLISAGVSALAVRFSEWQKAREEERLRREEEEAEAAALEDETGDEVAALEDETGDEVAAVIENENLSSVDRGRKKKNEAPNIIIAESSDSKNNKPDETAKSNDELSSADHSENKVSAKEKTSDPAGINQTESLHIQVPEFMKGGKIHVSSWEEKPAGAKTFVRTKLSIDDFDLKIEGLDEDSTGNVSKETKTTIESFMEETIDNQSGAKEDSTAVENQVPASDYPEKTVVNAAHSRGRRSQPAQAMEIVQTEIEKYEFPPLELLEKSSNGGSQQSAASLKQTALKLQQTLESFGVGVQVTNVSCGPAVTRYELQPDQGVKVSRIVSLADDIKLNLAVADIRIEAPIPGKAAVGIEVPNANKEMVHLRELLESDKLKKMKSKLAFAVGKDISGQAVAADIEKMPHLLIAGATGSGKSVCINTIIMSILYRADPNEVKLIMIDPKVVELNVYNNLPHLLIPVVTDPKKAAGALNWAVTTMMERYNKFAEIGAKDIKSYNAKLANSAPDDENHTRMPQIVIVIDELADLMMVAQSEVEDAICRLAQLARAAGIHLVIATQRPSVNVITGLIKANVPSRIAFSVSSGVDSRTILDMNGAEKLLGNGDMLFYPQGYQKPIRVQGAFVSESEIAKVTDFIREHMSSKPVYSEEIKHTIETASPIASASASNSDRDIYFAEAGRFVIEKEKASIGMLQRVYKIGFNRAARIMDQLCDAGVVGPEIGTKPRQIVMSMEEFEQYLNENP